GKVAFPYAQKFTLKIVDKDNLPYIYGSGIVPDIIVNPTSIPNRSTSNMLIVYLMGHAAAINGEYFNAATFTDIYIPYYMNILKENGLQKQSMARLVHPHTGKLIDDSVFMGV